MTDSTGPVTGAAKGKLVPGQEPTHDARPPAGHARNPRVISVGCGSSGGTSRCLWDDVLGVAGLVDAVTFLGEVVAPVVVEVAVAGDGAQFEDGLCAG
jgi:hypothetical protein